MSAKKSSPRPWGCFSPSPVASSPFAVFPTPVGVFLYRGSTDTQLKSLPHARGGVSVFFVFLALTFVSSPRPWGCFFIIKPLTNFGIVFPTPVGVFPKKSALFLKPLCLPHARGGVSTSLYGITVLRQSSPRPWGCFRPIGQRRPSTRVFPTPVGVFL